MLGDVLIYMQARLFLILTQQSWDHFCTEFLHARICGDNLSNMVLFYVRVTCDPSNSQPMITIHHLPYSLDIELNPACWRTSAPRVIFHLLVTLFEPLEPLKNVCTTCCYLHTLAGESFRQPDQKFQIYLLLDVHRFSCSVLHCWTT